MPVNSILSKKFARKDTLENKKENNDYKQDINQNTIVSKKKRNTNKINNINSLNSRSKTSKLVNYSISINKNQNETPLKKKLNIRNSRNLPQTYFNSQSKVKKCLSQKAIIIQNIKSSTNITNNINYINNSLNDFQKKMRIRKNSTLVSPLKWKKKKDSLISKINFNIQKNNQNLNNTDEFYSNYFNSIILGELSNQKKNNKKDKIGYSPQINHKKK